MQPAVPAILTIFGITGDLVKRKLLPALYQLIHADLLPADFRVMGVTRRGTTVEALIKETRDALASSNETCDEESLKRLEDVLAVMTLDLTLDDEYKRLKDALDGLEQESGVCQNRLFYLSIPPSSFADVAQHLSDNGLSSGCDHGHTESRLLIEKPFGYDVDSAQKLVTQLQEAFDEKQIYRIDHYLAKETVQNILTFRFQNPLFKSSWNNQHISHIMLTAAESIGIENRVDFYEQTGALRDLFQSHMLQLIALLTMEEPADMSAEAIHESKLAVMKKIKSPDSENMAKETVRGQYDTYRQEVGSQTSDIDTFAAVKLSVDDPKWQNVPILLRTGKALCDKMTEATILYQNPDDARLKNTLTIRIQPNEGIVLDMRIKRPGFEHETQTVQMDFCYGGDLDAEHPDAYERVLMDVLRGDKTLFSTSEEVMESWNITQPILSAWEAGVVPLKTYKSGSWGPAESDKMIESTGAEWSNDSRHICSLHARAS
jgi:glucose-6-phosphate 1-dehydrogenase